MDRSDDVFARAISAEAMAERIAKRPRVIQGDRRARLSLQAGIVLLALVGVLMAAAVAFVIGSRMAPRPTVQMSVVEQVVDAVNQRDVRLLRSLFAADGTLEFPNVDSRTGREGQVFMSDWTLDVENFPENWMGSLDKWGLEARLGACPMQSEATISCAVRTRWHVLQLEIGEEWMFDFEGARVRRLEMVRVDAKPSNSVLPLGLTDLERWEIWLRMTNPAQADRLLPTEPDIFGHFYFRFGPGASPNEIGASIREFVGALPSLPSPTLDPAAAEERMRSACRASKYPDYFTCEQVVGLAVTGETTLTVRTRLGPGAVDGRAGAICQDIIDWARQDLDIYGIRSVEILNTDGEIAARCDFPSSPPS